MMTGQFDWFATLVKTPSTECSTCRKVAGSVVACRRIAHTSLPVTRNVRYIVTPKAKV